MIAARHLNLDRLHCVEFLGLLRTGLEQLEFEPGGKSRLGNVHQQTLDFGLVGEQPKQIAEGLLHFLKLSLERLEIRGFPLFNLECLLELFLSLRFFFQLSYLGTSIEPVACAKHRHAKTQQDQQSEYRGPASDVVRIQLLKILYVHGAFSYFSFAGLAMVGSCWETLS